jgi:hypothetical protein
MTSYLVPHRIQQTYRDHPPNNERYGDPLSPVSIKDLKACYGKTTTMVKTNTNSETTIIQVLEKIYIIE